MEVYKLGGESLTGLVFHLLVKRKTCEAGEDETEKKRKDFWQKKKAGDGGTEKKKERIMEENRQKRPV